MTLTHSCPTCEGVGLVERQIGSYLPGGTPWVDWEVVKCPDCDGTGQIETTCHHCDKAPAMAMCNDTPVCAACEAELMEDARL